MSKPSSIAVMQPYFFPYFGYWQLINSVEKFVIYDDVNFIKNGWINRNSILANEGAQFINLSVKKVSSNKKINAHQINFQFPWVKKIKKQLKFTYSNAPFYNTVYPLIEDVLQNEEENLGLWLASSIQKITNFLQLNTQIIPSSTIYNNMDLDRKSRLYDICKNEKASHYINAIGGKELYNKEEFAKEGINLEFIESNPIEYKQFTDEFIPNLSIIDVMMFNEVETIQGFLQDFTLS